MIYAVHAEGTEFIKFGYTADISMRRRISTMQTGCPFTLVLLAFCRGDEKTESWLHWRLVGAKAFQRGEWFKDCPEARTIIQEMQEDSLKPKLVNSSLMEVEQQRPKRLASALEVASRKSGEWRLERKKEKEQPATAAFHPAPARHPDVFELAGMARWVEIQGDFASAYSALIAASAKEQKPQSNQDRGFADSSIRVEECAVSQ